MKTKRERAPQSDSLVGLEAAQRTPTGGREMKTKRRMDLRKVGNLIGGRLFGYTFAFSLAAHLGLFGWLAWTHESGSGASGYLKSTGSISVTGIHRTRVVTPDTIPPAPSIEPDSRKAPPGLPGKTSVTDAVPIPWDDAQAQVDTVDNPLNYQNNTLPPGVDIIVNPSNNVRPEDVTNVDQVNITDFSEPPVVVSEARPRYPDLARDAGVEGDVVLLVYIDEEGRVRNALVQSSPGLPVLDDEAKKAAYKCTFKPARQQGQPVGVWYSIVMQFRI